jgi:uncharacterized damage-inducible protein DinB
MFRRLDDFLRAHEQLSQGTVRVLDALTDEILSQAVAPGHRTLRDMAWHITVSVPEMMNRTGLGMASIDHESAPPDSADAIREGYRKGSTELAEALGSNWTDATLEETDDMYGEQWSRGQTLTALVVHEVHHRGEMIVLLRQAGARVPGLYGPAKEEWSQFGMEPPAY